MLPVVLFWSGLGSGAFLAVYAFTSTRNDVKRSIAYLPFIFLMAAAVAKYLSI